MGRGATETTSGCYKCFLVSDNPTGILKWPKEAETAGLREVLTERERQTNGIR